MTALTQWVAQNVTKADELERSLVRVESRGGTVVLQGTLAELLDIWYPDWRQFTQESLGAIPNPAFDPDKPCPHNDFEIGVNIQRIVDAGMKPISYIAEIQVACKVCDERWRWSGLQPGLSHHEPMRSVDGLTLLAPFRPASADDDFGMGLPGFNVNLVGPTLGHERTAAAVRKRALEDAAELVRRRMTPTNSISGNRELRQAAAALIDLADKDPS